MPGKKTIVCDFPLICCSPTERQKQAGQVILLQMEWLLTLLLLRNYWEG